MLTAANIMRPNPQDPANKTDFTHVMHVNPGGVADTWIGAKVVNRLYASAAGLPPALEAAANRSAPAKKAT